MGHDLKRLHSVQWVMTQMLNSVQRAMSYRCYTLYNGRCHIDVTLCTMGHEIEMLHSVEWTMPYKSHIDVTMYIGP